MTLGEKIFRLRTEQGFSQETFGEKLGVSRQSVSTVSYTHLTLPTILLV